MSTLAQLRVWDRKGRDARSFTLTDKGLKALAHCEGKWPRACKDEFPASRWAWCRGCRDS